MSQIVFFLFAAFFLALPSVALALDGANAVSGSAGLAPRGMDNAAADAAAAANAEMDAAARISGSRRPGVIDHFLQRPLPDSPLERPSAVEMSINYPSLGRNDIDADIRHWVTSIADAFEEHLDVSALGQPVGEGAGDLPAFELRGTYGVSWPSEAAASITFEVWNYAGGGQGNLDIMTLNYSLLTGQRLGLVDIFEKPETALELMSVWARQELTRRFGARAMTQMLKDGTEALVENFSSLTLTPEGICINFQPYQVTPWPAGAQKVDMPLEELLAARPLLALWGR